MPVMKNRGEHVKVYRPRGTPYSEGRSANLTIAISIARQAFRDEFGREPAQEHMIFECIGTSTDWVVNLFEVQ